jgi:hypothetical protein
MIGAQALLASARALKPSANPSAAMVTHIVTALRSRRVPRKGGPSRLRYPGRRDDLQGAAAALERVRQSDVVEFAMLSDLLREPLRAYRMPGDDASTRHKLIGSWSLDDGSISIGHADVTARPDAAPAERLDIAFRVLRAPAIEDAVADLEAVFFEITPADRLGDRYRDPKEALLWVGDSGRAGASGAGWKDKVAAIAEARGLDVAFCEQPGAFQRTHTEIARFEGKTLAVWENSAGPFARRDVLPPKWRAQAIYLEEPDFGEALEELRLMLDEGVPESESVESWEQFSSRLPELESDAFVVTERCRNSLRSNPYPDPRRMWDFVERLSRAARDRQALGGEVGERLAEWVAENYEIEIALHDSGLGAWAEFTFEGRQYSREPHVKVDDFKDPSECGRIYFAIDQEPPRFIVDHIGLHP